MLRNFFHRVFNLRKNLVIQNIALVTGIAIIIKGLSFYKETIIASTFGLSEILDTFLLAMVFPSLVSNIFLGSFKNTFIPNYIAASKNGENTAAFQGTGILITALTSLFFIIITYLTTDVFLEYLFPDHTPTYYENVRKQLYFILPSLFFWGFSGLLKGLLNIHKEFRHSSLSDIFMPLVLILFLLFLREEIGEYVLAIGTLVGSITGFLYILTVTYRRKILAVAKPNFSNMHVRVMLKQVPAKIISSILAQLHKVISIYFAAQLVIGSVSALNYGVRVTTVGISLLVIGVSNVLLPYFSREALKDQNKTIKNLFLTVNYVFLALAAVAVLGILNSDLIIRFLFERGEFTVDDTRIVSNIQMITLIYLPFKVCQALFVSFLTSINKNNYLAYVSFFSIVIDVILILLLIDDYGVYGIAIATTAAVILRSILLYIFIRRQRQKS